MRARQPAFKHTQPFAKNSYTAAPNTNRIISGAVNATKIYPHECRITDLLSPQFEFAPRRSPAALPPMRLLVVALFAFACVHSASSQVRHCGTPLGLALCVCWHDVCPPSSSLLPLPRCLQATAASATTLSSLDYAGLIGGEWLCQLRTDQ